jgi:hypothetical protein
MGKNRVTNVYVSNNKKSYGLFRFLWDFFLGCITGGLWWVFLLIRYLRTN